MGVEAFQRFIKQKCPTAFVPVDLLKVAQAVGIRPKNMMNVSGLWSKQSGALHVVIDGECCLDRLYGGYFNDWSCGGQWNRMLQFSQLLMATMQGNQIYVAVFFNGAFENERFGEWVSAEQAKLEKIQQIFRHIKRRKTPPPKILWLPPAGLRSSLKLALRHLTVPVFQTVEDHKSEVMNFLRQHDYDALLVEGAEYAFFDPPHYFSAESLKLTFKGSLETHELVLDEVAKQLDLHPNRFCLFAALLGNFIMPEGELLGFYEELITDVKLNDEDDMNRLIQALLAFVRNLATIDDLSAIGAFIFRRLSNQSDREKKAKRFVRSAQYYMNNTRNHFEQFWKPKPLQALARNVKHFAEFASESKGGELHDVPNHYQNDLRPPFRETDLEKLREEMESIMSFNEEGSSSHQLTNNVSITPPGARELSANSGKDLAESSIDGQNVLLGGDSGKASPSPVAVCENHADAINNLNQVANAAMCAKNALSQAEANNTLKDNQNDVPDVANEVLRVSYDRHKKGYMHPWIYHCLSEAAIKINCYLEDGNELPFGWYLWRPVRQRVYAILFNLNHRIFLSEKERESSKSASKSQQNSSNSNNSSSNSSSNVVKTDAKPGKEPGKYPADLCTRIYVKEWICIPKRNVYQQPESVLAAQLNWKGVPTVQRLWFGRQQEDKKKRLHSFIHCLLAESTPLLFDTKFVPQHLLLFACILRYMVAYQECRILQRHELDAFLAQAISPQLLDPNSLQEVQIKSLTPRGIHLAHLFMQGVEHALFANDACGAPIPWVMCCPWLFFDGKLFQMKLDLAERQKPLIEICGGQMDQVSQVERIRRAILDGISSPFYAQSILPGRHMTAAFPWLSDSTNARAMTGRRDILNRGGQLEIAGVVVGHWSGQGEKGAKIRGSSTPPTRIIPAPMMAANVPRRIRPLPPVPPMPYVPQMSQRPVMPCPPPPNMNLYGPQPSPYGPPHLHSQFVAAGPPLPVVPHHMPRNCARLPPPPPQFVAASSRMKVFNSAPPIALNRYRAPQGFKTGSFSKSAVPYQFQPTYSPSNTIPYVISNNPAGIGMASTEMPNHSARC